MCRPQASTPCPTKRHPQRRFVADETVTRLARVIAGGGIFRFATDIDHYAEWTLLRLLRSKDFEWTAARADDWRKPWCGFAGTRYEATAIQHNAILISVRLGLASRIEAIDVGTANLGLARDAAA